MLAYILALTVGLGSFALYMAAFFFPEVHRKYDFLWSGVGLFYALVLWVCAGRITGGVLLGQTASVALLGWFGWQTLQLRRIVTAPDQQTQISGSVAEGVQRQLRQLPDRIRNWLTALPLPGLDKLLDQLTTALTNLKDVAQGILATTRRSQHRPSSPPIAPPPEAIASPLLSIEHELDTWEDEDSDESAEPAGITVEAALQTLEKEASAAEPTLMTMVTEETIISFEVEPSDDLAAIAPSAPEEDSPLDSPTEAAAGSAQSNAPTEAIAVDHSAEDGGA